MNCITENIKKDIEKKILEIKNLADWCERNSWEFEMETPEETFWLELNDKLLQTAIKLKNETDLQSTTR